MEKPNDRTDISNPASRSRRPRTWRLVGQRMAKGDRFSLKHTVAILATPRCANTNIDDLKQLTDYSLGSFRFYVDLMQ